MWNRFLRDTGVEEVVLPGTLREISPEIFKDCDSLRTVRVAKDCPIDVESMIDSSVEVRRE